MGRTIKVKVPVETLIASAEKQREAIIKNHTSEAAKAQGQRDRWQKKALEALDRAYQDIESGDFPDIDRVWGKNNTSEFEVKVRAPRPVTPGDKPDTSRVDADLSLLRACTDETLSIGTDDNFARYL